MKILELHIRNIASVEKADIDFENDPNLQDPDTGKAAQKFLIFGDTGTGKSVLLDCISMALFNKTPRLDEIKNKNNNSFHNTNNNEVRIGSLEQYTRLGISAKDDCYSEVVFEGNNGTVYRARTELGMSESKGKLIYRKRKWTLQAGNEAEVKVDTNGRMITDVIGMTYDQFNRMAMLAQGQFANFLCGDRKERAEILEKLTNTELFSMYGKAIHDIYSRKEKDCITAKNVMEAVENIVLPDDEAQALKDSLVAEEKNARQASEKKKLLSDRISLVDKILENQKNVDAAAEHLTVLRGEMESDSFKAQKALCADWDDTDEERKRMSELIANRKSLADACEQEKALKERFATLAADLAKRQRDFDDEARRLSEVDRWLAERQDHDTLYTESRLVLASLDRYEADCHALDGKKKDYADAVAQTAVLSKELLDAEIGKVNALGNVKSAQDEINRLLEDRNLLNPKQMDTDTVRLAKLRTAYETLRIDHSKWLESVAERDKQTSNLTELSKTLDDKRTEQKDAQEAYNTAAADNEKAMRLFSAVNASLDDKLDELRKRIVADDVEICPLCGQKIAGTILTKEQFASLLTPYEENLQSTKKAAANALERLTKANGDVNSIAGQITTLRQQLDSQNESIKAVAVKLSERMVKAGIDESGDIEAAFDLKLAQLAGDELELQRKRNQLAKLQEEIDRRQKSKSELDANLNTATAKLTVAKAKAENNSLRIDSLSGEISALETALAAAVEKLDSALAPFFPKWRDDVKDTSSRLSREASEYLDRKTRAADGHASLENRRGLLDQYLQIKDRISAANDDWKADEIATVEFNDPTRAWNDLLDSSIAVRNRIDSCRLTIEESGAVLAAWRQRSGKDDDYLRALMASRDDVAEARRQIATIEGSVSSWQKISEDAKIGVSEARKALSLNDEESVPDRNELQKLFLEQDEIERESTRLYTIAKTKLEKDEEDQKTMKKAREDYEASKKEKDHWSILDSRFGGERFRNLVQTQILIPLLNNANHYLCQINDRYTLTCTAENEQLSILVLDRFNRNEVRSATVLSGGEKFMISLALSLALSSLNRPDMNVNILFIDEGFGTLDQECLNSVMTTLGKLGEMSGQSSRRVGIISHREELLGCIPNKIKLKKIGEGRSKVEIVYEP